MAIIINLEGLEVECVGELSHPPRYYFLGLVSYGSSLLLTEL